ncbi:replication initiation protein (plasmid) [Pseudomonas sp. DTU_2021_1001937_2_SI_NGA_ILE_001]|uniref:replication initiation protein n=1 Tax=Pseudomonas sp. DTU_2021_1001937_2_SI_NGA_ILE_001 TaxID=3077589 RepID=UPI0028FC1D0F|nr:replication initiation protein [Pseudomonas sp. DTU_2021_1001937_2_SI_NGA_ILE_001]WNW14381.1 replication initiation protein [Pseudomonas sp. DTU_2021_1001937_2_SI_NGA_ILE_001]
MAQEKIYKSNALIEASYTLSVAEQRIILACIAQVDRGSPITDEVLYSIPVASIVKATGSDSKSIYKELLEASRKLRQRGVSIELEPNGGGRKAKTLEASWVQSIVYNEREGAISLRFNKDMLPFLTELKEQFTRYDLSDVARMTSLYGIRLFEMLVQYASIGCREIALADLRKWLRLDDKYPLMADLRRYVIAPAVSQLNEHSPLRVRYELKRHCRKITHLNFIIAHKRLPAAEAEPAAEKPPQRIALSNYELSRLAHKGESLSDALTRLNAYIK